MKKSQIKVFFVSALFLISLFSFIYINTADVGQEKSSCIETELEETNEEDSKVFLPDAKLVKKILETGKRLIPST